MAKHTIAIGKPLYLMLALFVAATVGVAYLVEHERLRGEIDREIARVEDVMASQLGEDLRLLNATLLAIGESGLFSDALAAGDRERLLEEARPLFRGMRAEADISHFYFTGPDRVNILRVHKPDQYGDVIDRFTTVEAQRTGGPTQGVEIGPLGTLTMRVVYPQYRDGECIGFIELGHDLGEHIELLGKTLDIDLRVLIKKKSLDRAGWQAGLATFNRSGDWDALPDFVQTVSEAGGLDAKATERLGTDRPGDRKGSFTAEVNGSPARIAYLPVVGASGDDVGRLVVIMDVSDQEAGLVRFLLTVAMVAIAIAGLFGSLVTILVGRVSSELER